MVEKLQRKINDSPSARWMVLIAVSLAMMCGYFLCDVMGPLKSLLEQNLGWTSMDFGIFNSAFGWLNVILLMLIVGGIILDRMGPRFTGIMAVSIMLVGAVLKFSAIEFMDPTRMVILPIFGEIKLQVFSASCAYALFAFGYETMGITATKIVVRWFRGKEMALALGMNVAFARIGTMLAMMTPVPIAKYFDSISAPILFSTVMLLIGFAAFMLFYVMDKKLDAQQAQEKMGDDEKFRLGDIFLILRSRGFWLIACLCLLFYSAVFPFLKFAVEFVTIKFHVDSEFAGIIPGLLPLGTLFLTPLFGGIYDKKGRGATMMLIGAVMLVLVYVIFSIKSLDHWGVSVGVMILLGIAFSLVPSAMWPSVAKIIPERRLGTAYSLIFWVQGIGLSGVPLLISWVLDKHGRVTNIDGSTTYDYTIPIYMFMGLGVLAVCVALLLRRENRIRGYGLEEANIKASK